jgi:phage-related protein
MGTDGEVVIPIRLEADKLSLHELEKEISDMFARTGKLGNSPAKLEIFSKLMGDISNISGEIAGLQQELEHLNKTPVNPPVDGVKEKLADVESALTDIYNLYDEANDRIDTANAEITKQTSELHAVNNELADENERYENLVALSEKASGVEAERLNVEMEASSNRMDALVEQGEVLRENIEKNKSIIAYEKDRIVSAKQEEQSERYYQTQLEQELQKLNEIHESEEGLKKAEEERARTEKDIRTTIEERTRDLQKEAAEVAKILATEEERQRVSENTSKTDLLKEQKAEIQAQIRAEQEVAKQAKLTTSQYYYRLRSMKMVNRYLQMLNGAMDNFGKKSLNVSANIVKNYIKVATGFGLLRKSIGLLLGSLGKIGGRLGTVSKAFAKTNKEVRRTTAAHKDFGKSITTNLKLFLRYALGIRSLFVLFNRLRSAMMDGLTALATQFDDVNSDMSSLKSSLVQMKNSLASMVQPIVSVLVPAFESLSESISNVSVKVASFFAAFTGQDYVYKAKRTQEQFVESVEDSNKAMEDSADASEEAKGQLQSYDKLLNVTTKDEKKKDDDDKKDPLTNAFDVVPINKKVADIVDKIKDLLSRLFAPLKKAWDKEGKFVMDAWKYALGEIWKLIKDIGRDFMRVWEEPRTQEIFENILHVLGDIGLVIGHLARNFREAWNENENGYRILAAIRDIIWVISKGLREAADYTVEWADALSFKPLMNAIADVLEKQIVPAVQKIVDLLVYLYTKIFLEILRFLIEDLLPIIVHIFGNLVESIGNLAENIHKALAEGQLGEHILKEIEDIVMIVAKGLLECSKYTVEWSKNIDFAPLFKEMFNLLTKVKGATQQIVDLCVYLYENILTKIVQDLIEKGLPQIERILGYVVETIGNIAGQLHKALEENDRGVQILEHTEILVGKVADAIEYCAKATAEWAGELDFGPLLDAIDNFLVKAQPMVQFIADVLSKLWVDVLLPLWTYLIEEGLPKLLDTLGKISDMIDWEKLKERVDAFLESFEKFLEKAWDTFVIILGDLGTAIANFVNSDTFGNFIDLLIKWMDEADPNEMAKGIEQLVVHFIAMRAALSFLTYLGALREFVMTLVNWHNNKAMTTTIAQTSENIAALNKNLEGLPQKLAEAKAGADGTATAIGTLGSSSSTSSAMVAASSVATVASIALIGAAIVTLWMTNEDFRNHVTGLWQDIQDAFSTYSQKIVDNLNSLGFEVDELKDIWISFCNMLAPAIEGVLSGIASVLESWMQMVSGVIQTISGVVNTVIGIVEAFKNKDVTRLKEGITQLLEGITDAYSGTTKTMNYESTIMSEGINSQMLSVAESVIGTSDNMETSVSDSTSMMSENVATNMSNMSDSVIDSTVAYDSLTKNLQTVSEQYNLTAEQTNVLNDAFNNNIISTDNLNTSMENLNTSVSNTSLGVSETMPLVSESIGTAMTTATNSVAMANTEMQFSISELISRFSQMPQDMSSGFDLSWAVNFGLGAEVIIARTINPAFGALLAWILEFFGIESPSKVFESIGTNLIDGFVLGIDNTWPNITKWFTENLNGLIAQISDIFKIFGTNDPSKVLEEIGQNFINGFELGLDETWHIIWEWFEPSINELLDAIRDFWDDFVTIGNLLIEGLLTGLQEKWDDVVDWIMGVCADLIGDVKEFFGIRSPSRVMMSIGEYISDGLAVGIESDSNKSIRAAKDMANDIVEETSRIAEETPDDIELNFALTESLTNLEKMVEQANTLRRVFSSIDAIATNVNDNMKIPDIVKGKVLPTKVDIATAKNSDAKDNAISSDEMYNIINDAVYSAINSAYKNGMFENEMPTIELDGYNIAKAVQRENHIYTKSTGRSMF